MRIAVSNIDIHAGVQNSRGAAQSTSGDPLATPQPQSVNASYDVQTAAEHEHDLNESSSSSSSSSSSEESSSSSCFEDEEEEEKVLLSQYSVLHEYSGASYI